MRWYHEPYGNIVGGQVLVVKVGYNNLDGNGWSWFEGIALRLVLQHWAILHTVEQDGEKQEISFILHL